MRLAVVAHIIGHFVVVRAPYRVEIGVAFRTVCGGIIGGKVKFLGVISAGRSAPARKGVACAREYAAEKRYGCVIRYLLQLGSGITGNVVMIYDIVSSCSPARGEGIGRAVGLAEGVDLGSRVERTVGVIAQRPPGEIVTSTYGIRNIQRRIVVLRETSHIGTVPRRPVVFGVVKIDHKRGPVDTPHGVERKVPCGIRRVRAAIGVQFVSGFNRSAAVRCGPALKRISLSYKGIAASEREVAAVYDIFLYVGNRNVGVVLIDHSVRIRIPVCGKGIGYAGSGAEGVGHAHILGGSNGAVGAGIQSPAGEGIAGSRRFAETLRIAVGHGVGILNACKRAAAEINVQRGLILLRGRKRERDVVGEVRRAVAARDRSDHNVGVRGGKQHAFGQVVTFVHGKEHVVGIKVSYHLGAYGNGIERKARACVVHKGDRMLVYFRIAERNGDVAGGCGSHLDADLIARFRDLDLAVIGNGHVKIGNERGLVAVVQRKDESVDLFKVYDGFGGNVGPGETDAVVQHKACLIGVFGGRYCDNGVRGNGRSRDHVGALGARFGLDGEVRYLGRRSHGGRGAGITFVEGEFQSHFVAGIHRRGRGRHGNGNGGIKHRGNRILHLGAGEGHVYVALDAGKRYDIFVAGYPLAVYGGAVHYGGERVDIVFRVCGNGDRHVAVVVHGNAGGRYFVAHNVIGRYGEGLDLPVRFKFNVAGHVVDVVGLNGCAGSVVPFIGTVIVAVEIVTDLCRQRCNGGQRGAVGRLNACGTRFGKRSPGLGAGVLRERNGIGLRRPLRRVNVRTGAGAEGIGVFIPRAVYVKVAGVGLPTAEIVAVTEGRHHGILRAGILGYCDLGGVIGEFTAVAHAEFHGIPVLLGRGHRDLHGAGGAFYTVGVGGAGHMAYRNAGTANGGGNDGSGIRIVNVVAGIQRNGPFHGAAVDHAALYGGTAVAHIGFGPGFARRNQRYGIGVEFRLAHRNRDIALVEAMHRKGDFVAGFRDISDIRIAHGNHGVEIGIRGVRIAFFKLYGIRYGAVVIDRLRRVGGGRNGITGFVARFGNQRYGEIFFVPLGPEVHGGAVHGGEVQFFNDLRRIVRTSGVAVRGIVRGPPLHDLKAGTGEEILRLKGNGGIVIIRPEEDIGNLFVVGFIIDVILMRLPLRFEGHVAPEAGNGNAVVVRMVLHPTAFNGNRFPSVEIVADLRGPFQRDVGDVIRVVALRAGGGFAGGDGIGVGDGVILGRPLRGERYVAVFAGKRGFGAVGFVQRPVAGCLGGFPTREIIAVARRCAERSIAFDGIVPGAGHGRGGVGLYVGDLVGVHGPYAVYHVRHDAVGVAVSIGIAADGAGGVLVIERPVIKGIAVARMIGERDRFAGIALGNVKDHILYARGVFIIVYGYKASVARPNGVNRCCAAVFVRVQIVLRRNGKAVAILRRFGAAVLRPAEERVAVNSVGAARKRNVRVIVLIGKIVHRAGNLVAGGRVLIEFHGIGVRRPLRFEGHVAPGAGNGGLCGVGQAQRPAAGCRGGLPTREIVADLRGPFQRDVGVVIRVVALRARGGFAGGDGIGVGDGVILGRPLRGERYVAVFARKRFVLIVGTVQRPVAFRRGGLPTREIITVARGSGKNVRALNGIGRGAGHRRGGVGLHVGDVVGICAPYAVYHVQSAVRVAVDIGVAAQGTVVRIVLKRPMLKGIAVDRAGRQRQFGAGEIFLFIIYRRGERAVQFVLIHGHLALILLPHGVKVHGVGLRSRGIGDLRCVKSVCLGNGKACALGVRLIAAGSQRPTHEGVAGLRDIGAAGIERERGIVYAAGLGVGIGTFAVIHHVIGVGGPLRNDLIGGVACVGLAHGTERVGLRTVVEYAVYNAGGIPPVERIARADGIGNLVGGVVILLNRCGCGNAVVEVHLQFGAVDLPHGVKGGVGMRGGAAEHGNVDIGAEGVNHGGAAGRGGPAFERITGFRREEGGGEMLLALGITARNGLIVRGVGRCAVLVGDRVVFFGIFRLDRIGNVIEGAEGIMRARGVERTVERIGRNLPLIEHVAGGRYERGRARGRRQIEPRAGEALDRGAAGIGTAVQIQRERGSVAAPYRIQGNVGAFIIKFVGKVRCVAVLGRGVAGIQGPAEEGVPRRGKVVRVKVKRRIVGHRIVRNAAGHGNAVQRGLVAVEENFIGLRLPLGIYGNVRGRLEHAGHGGGIYTGGFLIPTVEIVAAFIQVGRRGRGGPGAVVRHV